MDAPVSDQGLDKLPVHSAPGVVHDLLDLKLIIRHSFSPLAFADTLPR